MSGKKKVSALAAFAVVGATGLWGAGVTAQIMTGPFTAAQADAGRAAYVTNCMACHQANMAGEGDALPLVGKTFMAAWGNRTTKELYETIHTSMPYGNGGSLDAKTYTDLTAFILQSNGSKPSNAPLTTSTAIKLSMIATGTVSADVSQGLKASARTPSGGRDRQAQSDTRDFGGPPTSSDNGAGMIHSFGQTVVGDIKNYVPVTDEMLTHPSDSVYGDAKAYLCNFSSAFI